MPGELAEDEIITDAERAYIVDVYNIIMDTIYESIHRCFLSHGTLYADFALLEPRNFLEICSNNLAPSALQELSKCLLPFDDRATVTNLQCELKSLAAHWEKLKTTALDEYRTRSMRDDDEDAEMENKNCLSCKNCAVCCYQILKRYNLFTDAYHIIGLAYKFVSFTGSLRTKFLNSEVH